MTKLQNLNKSIIFISQLVLALFVFTTPCVAEVAYPEEETAIAHDYPPYEPDESVEYEEIAIEADMEEDLIYPEDDPFGFPADEPVMEEEIAVDEEPYNAYAEELAATLGAGVWYWNIIETGINAPTAAELAAELGINLTEGLGAAGEAGISLEAAGAAEAGAVTGLTAAVLYGVIIAEVVVVGAEVYLIYSYNEEIDEIAEDYVEMAEELGQTEEEALAELEEDLYTENTYWDNFVDIYCVWCD
jgi:hypothetical protein